MDRPTRRRTIVIRKIVRITLRSILFLFLFIIVVLLLILTPPVQNFLRKKAVTYLENKLQTKVAIGRIYIGLPSKVIAENIYVEDRLKDTLLSAGSLRMNINVLKLLFKRTVDISKTDIENCVLKIKRQLPDTVFNYQFISDAFGSGNTNPTSTDTTTTALSLGSIVLNKARIVYKDVVTGNNIETWIDHLDTKTDLFDPTHLHFNIPETNVSGVAATIYHAMPLGQQDPNANDPVTPSQASTLQLAFNEVNLEHIALDYRNEMSATNARVELGRLTVKPTNIDMVHRIVEIKNVSLENSIVKMRLGKKAKARATTTQTKGVNSQAPAGWLVKAGSIALENNNIAFDDDNSKPVKSGIDYSHLAATGLSVELSDLALTDDSITVRITGGAFKEKSGFVLNELRGDLLYTHDRAYVKDLLIKTPGSEVKRYALLKYRSAEDLLKNPDRIQIDADIENSYVQVKDILMFAPQFRRQPAFSDPNSTWTLNFQGDGDLQAMHIRDLQFKGLKGTRIDVSGTIANTSDPNLAAGKLTIREFHTNRSDIAMMSGNRLSASPMNFPEELDARGTFIGSINNFSTHLTISTSDGTAVVDGRFTDLTNPIAATYSASLKTNSLNLASLLGNHQLGMITSEVTASGKGFTPGKMAARFNGSIVALGYNAYTYRNISFDGKIQQSNFSITADIKDPNAHLNGTASGQLSNNLSFRFEGMIDSIKLLPLHFTSDALVMRGKIDADVPVMNQAELQANVLITKALLVSDSQRLPLDTIQFVSGKNDTANYMQLKSNVANALLTGQYRYTDLGTILQKSIEPFLVAAPVSAVADTLGYTFSFAAEIGNTPTLAAFIPGLQSFDRVRINGRASNGVFTATMTAATIKYNGNEINGLEATLSSSGKRSQLSLDTKRVKGTGLDIYHATLEASASNNKTNFRVSMDDKVGKNKILVAGNVENRANGSYAFHLNPDSLILNYRSWNISPNNSLILTKENITADQFVLQQGEQKLSLQSVAETLNIEFNRFQLSTITLLTNSDTLALNGSISGKLAFKNLLRQPVFISDLNITDLSMNGDTLGNAAIKVDNTQSDRYNTRATLTGKSNDIELTGSFSPQGKTDIAMDLTLAVRRLQLSSVQGAFANVIKNASGSINGNVTIKGTTAKPIINGPLNFDKASFAFSAMGSQFKLDGEKITVTQNGFHFDNFVIRDEANNELTFNGYIQTPNFTNYSFDLGIGAVNFEVLNSTKRQNKLYYGKLIISSRLHIKGTEAAPTIDGNITVNEGTNLTVVIPQIAPGVVERDGIVEFVDMKAPENDSLFRTSTDSLNITPFKGMNITTNIEIKKEAELNLVIDEANGDFLHIQGEGLLSTGIDPSGKITLVGTYELQSGTYEIIFNFLHRRFEIQKGSKITWLNEPTKANLDVRATYIANTSPIDLVDNQIAASSQAIRNTYLQKLPFEVRLFMTGELLQPVIKFDIVLPQNKNYGVSNDIITQVDTRLEQLRQDSGEIDKQVFALLLMNRFVGQNPLQSKSPGFNASTYARQSVSKLLTSELNRFAENLIDGVDLTFNVTSSDDYTTGDRRSRTDLNIGLSKRLLHERLTVALGSNYELEGPKNSNQKPSNFVGDLSVNYALSRDGRYKLRFYRINEYEGIVDGYIVETGVSFIISVDYNRFAEIIRKKKNQKVDGVNYATKEK